MAGPVDELVDEVLTLRRDGRARPRHRVEAEFDIPELGEPNTVIMDIKRCDTRCGDVMLNRWRLTPNHVIGNPNEFLIKLKAGRYVVRVSRAVDDPGPVHFGWRPQAF